MIYAHKIEGHKALGHCGLVKGDVHEWISRTANGGGERVIASSTRLPIIGMRLKADR
jgi:hypothetical protein